MLRRSILSAAERESLMALPDEQDDLIQYYSFTESDLSLIRQRRGDANRIGFAVQLCLLRYPGYVLASDVSMPDPLIQWIARQIRRNPATWPQYGARDKTRREHLQELRAYLNFRHSVCLTFACWCIALPTSPCKLTKARCSQIKPLTPYGNDTLFYRR